MKVLLDCPNGGTFYETDDGRVCYEKRNGQMIGPTPTDAIRCAYDVLRKRLEP